MSRLDHPAYGRRRHPLGRLLDELERRPELAEADPTPPHGIRRPTPPAIVDYLDELAAEVAPAGLLVDVEAGAGCLCRPSTRCRLHTLP